MKISVLEHTQKSFANLLQSQLGRGAEHAGLLYSQWMRTGKLDDAHPAFANAKQLFSEIVESVDWTLPQLVRQLSGEQAEKFLIKLADGYEVESVAIKMQFGYTLCVSSQVGCRMGCAFCQTGRMGLLRHLSVAEIVQQLFAARQMLGYNIRNIVFMGMGEPMDNFDAVKRAIEIFTDPSGFGLASKHITISTSGRVDGIRRMAEECDPKINLAVSINAPNDMVRTKLMPLNRKYSMAVLKEALLEYLENPKREILIEYVMIKGYTDIPGAAEQLASYLQGLRVKVNLIPYNPQNPDPFECSEADVIEAFANDLRHYGFRVLVRGTKGQRTMAACGQLGNLAYRKRISKCHSR